MYELPLQKDTYVQYRQNICRGNSSPHSSSLLRSSSDHINRIILGQLVLLCQFWPGVLIKDFLFPNVEWSIIEENIKFRTRSYQFLTGPTTAIFPKCAKLLLGAELYESLPGVPVTQHMRQHGKFENIWCPGGPELHFLSDFWKHEKSQFSWKLWSGLCSTRNLSYKQNLELSFWQIKDLY